MSRSTTVRKDFWPVQTKPRNRCAPALSSRTLGAPLHLAFASWFGEGGRSLCSCKLSLLQVLDRLLQGRVQVLQLIQAVSFTEDTMPTAGTRWQVTLGTSKGNEEECLRQVGVMISMISFRVILQNTIDTWERFKGGNCRGQAHNQSEALGREEMLFFAFH